MIALQIALITGYLLDLLAGDPENWPHPVKVFGTRIARGESFLNSGNQLFLKGALLTGLLVTGTWLIFYALFKYAAQVGSWIYIPLTSLFVYWGLAGKGLVTECRLVFTVLETDGLEAGRQQLSRIVGRDTRALTAFQVKIASLETLAENLSDGFIAPLFYFAVGGIPAMMTYKMINTLDSMIGYRSVRYELFGKAAARLDDLANLIPSRLTACLMVLVSGKIYLFRFVGRYASGHKSPNSGYPEAAMAGIVNIRFGGETWYSGVAVVKAFIGDSLKEPGPADIRYACRINQATCFVMVLLSLIFIWYTYA